MESTPLVQAKTVDNEAAVVSRKGHSCCGCCCDMRRAVIICDIILLVGEVVKFVSLMVGASFTGALSDIDFDDFDDDLVAMNPEAFQQTQDFYTAAHGMIMAEMIFSVIGIVFSALAICGAMNFKWGLVVPNIVLLAIGGLAPLFYDPTALVYPVVAALWAYPHVVFCKEVRKGIMSKENYAEAEQSCCCV